MNVKTMKKLIGKEFDIIKDKSSLLSIAPLDSDYPEIYVKIVTNQKCNNFELIHVSRGKEFLEASLSTELEAFIALYFYGKNKLESTDYESLGNIEIEQASALLEIKNIFLKFFGDKYFSFSDMVPDRIILESENNRYNVLFLGKDNFMEYITKSRKLNIASEVMFNYCADLKRFDTLVENLKLKLDDDFNEKLKRLYVL